MLENRSIADLQAERRKLRRLDGTAPPDASERRYELAILIAGRRARTEHDYEAQLELLIEMVRPEDEPTLIGQLVIALRDGFPPSS